MTIYLQHDTHGFKPVYSDSAAEKLENKGWKRADIAVIWAEKRAANKKTSLSKKEIQLLLDEKGISYLKKDKIGTLRALL